MRNKNAVAIITGAAGGLGMSFANCLAAKKYNLLLTDIDDGLLKAVSAKLQNKYKVKIYTEAVDLTDDKQVSRFTKQIMNSNNIEILVNSAGFGEGEKFVDEGIERQLKMIQVHIAATVQLVHAVLPGMIERKNGKIITVSSMSAFIPAPGSSIYAATKSFLNSFMESIHMEVHKYGVQVQSLCPGLIRTGFHHKLEKEGKRSKISESIPWMEPDEVARFSLKCLDKGKVICIPGCFNKTIKKAIPVLPRKSYYSLTEKITQKHL